MKIIFAILLIVFVEIYTFIQVGALIGAMSAIMLTILSAMIGISLVKSQSNKEQMKALQKMQEGKSPMKESLSSVCLLIAGFLLLTPGLITDVLGALLLIPFVRSFFINHSMSKLEAFINKAATSSNTHNGAHIFIKGKPFNHTHDDETIDGVCKEVHNDNSK